uniref:Uncharacterized protein n=1 Tax=Leersia perrieri TaxID=77586 RepID=A0A0D9VGF3_9ORYZ
MAGGRAAAVLLLLVIATSGLADVNAATARLMSPPSSWSSKPHQLLPTTASSVASTSAAEAEELNGMMECMIGCFTQVFGCAFGCLGKGPDMALCVVGCNQKSVVCMLRCAITPPKPKPTPPPPSPTPKPPKPSPPKPPKPSPPTPTPSPTPPPPPGPPYAAYAGRSTDKTTLG